MKTSTFLTLIVASLYAHSVQAITQENLDKWVDKYDLLDGDLAAALRNAKFPAIFQFEASASLNRTVTLKMKPSNVFVGETPENLKDSFYSGTVEGFPRSAASLTVWKNGFTGRIRMEEADGDIHVLSVDKLDGTTKTVIYNNKDIKKNRNINTQLQNDTFSRKSAAAPAVANAESPVINRFDVPAKQRNAAGSLDCKMALVADSSFFQHFGDQTEKQMVSIMNDVSTIFSTTFNINLPVSIIAVDKADKLLFGNNGVGNEGKISELLQEASTLLEKEADRLKNICLTHVFTARTVGTTLGVAFVAKVEKNALGGICSGDSAVGVSTIKSGDGSVIPFSARVTTIAHEVGHGFGSSHDVDPACLNSIMAAAVRIGGPPVTQFSNCSINAIRRVLAAKATCLVPSP